MQQEFSAFTSGPVSFPLGQIDPVSTRRRRLRKGEHSSAPGPSKMPPMLNLFLSLLLCLALGLACLSLVSVWSSHFRGGFAWDRTERQFNWHPVLMTTGLVVLYGYSSVVYRVPLTWGHSKQPWKLLHSVLMLLALLLSVVGLCAVFQVHNQSHIPNLYSLHSWIGLSTVILFALQWVAGFAGFLLPWSPLSFRKLLKPLHVWLGGSILTLSIAACISGINEKLFFVLKGDNHTASYSKLPPEALLANFLGVLIVAFGLTVLRILTNRNWQRPDPTEQDAAYTALNQEEND